MERAPSPPPLVLVVNDQEWSARSIESILAAGGYAVIRASTSQQAIEQARSGNPDLILLDVGLPDRTGTETCRVLRADPRIDPATPILLTTAASTSRRERLEALAAGAWDYVPLPLDSEELLLRLPQYVSAKRECNRLRDLSLMEPRTGLYNTRGLLRRLREMTAEARRYDRPIACIIVAPEVRREDGAEKRSLEGEDTAVANRVAPTMAKHARTSDALGHIRPGEIGLLAFGADAAGALTLSRRLRDAVESLPTEPGLPRLSLNVGFHALASVAEGTVEAEECLALATKALRRSQTDPEAGPISGHDNGAAPPQL